MDKYDVWNKALALLPHDRRVTANDTATAEYRRCDDNWDAARMRVLTAHEWGWATVQSEVCGGCRVEGGMFGYPRPDGVVRIIGLFDPRGRRVKTQAYNNQLLSDCPHCFVRYIPDMDDPDYWPSWFTDAVVAELASRISTLITANAATERRLLTLAADRLALAVKTDSDECKWGGTDGRTFVNARQRGARWRRD